MTSHLHAMQNYYLTTVGAKANLSLTSLFYFFLLGHARGMRKFPGQGSNLCPSSDRSCCGDKAGSLASCVARELLLPCLLNPPTPSRMLEGRV